MWKSSRHVPLDATSQRDVLFEAMTQMTQMYGPLYGSALVTYEAASTLDPERIRAEAESYLTTVAQSPELAGVTLEKVAVEGYAAPAILGAIDDQHIDLVVLCSYGRTGISRWALGSVAQHVSRQSPVPVLVLRMLGAMPIDASLDTHEPMRVLVPLDGSEEAEAVIVPAAELLLALARQQPSEVRLVLVIDRFATAVGNVPELLGSGCRRLPEPYGRRLRAEYSGKLRVTDSLATDVDIASAIIAAAEQTDTDEAVPAGRSDMIAMATHGRTGFAKWSMGSITERVLHGTSLPMLIVRLEHISGGRRRQLSLRRRRAHPRASRSLSRGPDCSRRLCRSSSNDGTQVQQLHVMCARTGQWAGRYTSCPLSMFIAPS